MPCALRRKFLFTNKAREMKNQHKIMDNKAENIENQSDPEMNSTEEMDEEESDTEIHQTGPRPGKFMPILKKKKRGIIYISSIPKHMNVAILRDLLEEYGEVGRIFLQPEKRRE